MSSPPLLNIRNVKHSAVRWFSHNTDKHTDLLPGYWSARKYTQDTRVSELNPPRTRWGGGGVISRDIIYNHYIIHLYIYILRY